MAVMKAADEYLIKTDGSDKSLKLAQFVMKVMVDRVLGKEHPFEATRKVVHNQVSDARKYITVMKWGYQYVAVKKEMAGWGDAMTTRQCLKMLLIALTFTEQLSADLQLAQEIWFHTMPREWVDYILTLAKCSANFFSFLDDFHQHQSKQHYLAQPKPDSEKAAAYRRDVFRHRLSLIREVCDICLYLHWVDNWKRNVTSQQLNIMGLISSMLGVFDVACPHSYTSL